MSETIRFTSVAGCPLTARLWPAEGTCRAVIQIVHGMAEHIDRYDRTARALNAAGFTIVGHNHAGHGAEAAVKGYFAPKEGWDCLVQDVHSLRKLTEERYPGIPYILLGHSMGSFVVRCYMMQHAEGLSGVILSGTGYYGKTLVSAGLLLASIVCALGGSRKPSPLINAVGFGSLNNRFKPARTPFDWLSRDEAEVDKYVTDENCGFCFTGKGYQDLFTGLRQLTQTVNCRSIPADLPVLFISGGEDPVGQLGAGVQKVAGELKHLGLRWVDVQLFPGARHELFNETNREEAVSFLTVWINSVLSRIA